MSAIRIFISYRHNDSLDDVYAILQMLKKFFGDTAIVSDNMSKPAEANLYDWIDKTIQSSDVILLMIGKNWLTSTDAEGNSKSFNSSDAVFLEIACAFKYKKRIIPCILPGGAIPTEGQLPDLISDLAYINAALIPPKPTEIEWSGVIAQIINSIEITFRYYKDKSFWLLVCVWPIMISIISFLSEIVVGKLLGKFGIILQQNKYAGLYYIVSGIVWMGIYARKTAAGYTPGRRNIFFLPIQPFRFIFQSVGEFFESIFLGFPLNIFFVWLMTNTVAFFVFKYLGTGFELSFLVTYAIANYILLTLFSSNVAGNGRSYQNYEKLFPVKQRPNFVRFNRRSPIERLETMFPADSKYMIELQKKGKQAWLEQNAQAVSRGL
ncbi:MAG: TIR domain-containing protein [Chitinophagaceae bacterium]